MENLGLFDLDNPNDDGTYNLSPWILAMLEFERTKDDYVTDTDDTAEQQ